MDTMTYQERTEYNRISKEEIAEGEKYKRTEKVKRVYENLTEQAYADLESSNGLHSAGSVSKAAELSDRSGRNFERAHKIGDKYMDELCS